LCESESDAIIARSKLTDIWKTRGLELSPEKTSIHNIMDGFDFLGLYIRSYRCNINIQGSRGMKTEGYKLLIKPSQSSLKKIKEKLKFY
jgi:RNA-directed DNA polymerase